MYIKIYRLIMILKISLMVMFEVRALTHHSKYPLKKENVTFILLFLYKLCFRESK
jgi:hypothetical protein